MKFHFDSEYWIVWDYANTNSLHYRGGNLSQIIKSEEIKSEVIPPSEVPSTGGVPIGGEDIPVPDINTGTTSGTDSGSPSITDAYKALVERMMGLGPNDAYDEFLGTSYGALCTNFPAYYLLWDPIYSREYFMSRSESDKRTLIDHFLVDVNRVNNHHLYDPFYGNSNMVRLPYGLPTHDFSRPIQSLARDYPDRNHEADDFRNFPIKTELDLFYNNNINGFRNAIEWNLLTRPFLDFDSTGNPALRKRVVDSEGREPSGEIVMLKYIEYPSYNSGSGFFLGLNNKNGDLVIFRPSHGPYNEGRYDLEIRFFEFGQQKLHHSNYPNDLEIKGFSVQEFGDVSEEGPKFTLTGNDHTNERPDYSVCLISDSPINLEDLDYNNPIDVYQYRKGLEGNNKHTTPLPVNFISTDLLGGVFLSPKTHKDFIDALESNNIENFPIYYVDFNKFSMSVDDLFPFNFKLSTIKNVVSLTPSTDIIKVWNFHTNVIYDFPLSNK